MDEKHIARAARCGVRTKFDKASAHALALCVPTRLVNKLIKASQLAKRLGKPAATGMQQRL